MLDLDVNTTQHFVGHASLSDQLQAEQLRSDGVEKVMWILRKVEN